MGKHLYFKFPKGLTIPNSAGKLAEGVDVRAERGYVVAAGSRRKDGIPYSWASWSQIADLPPWLLPLLLPGPVPKPVSGRGQRTHAIPEGARNSTLASLAGAMRHKGMTQPAIKAALLKENIGRCSPPLPDAEVGQIADSISRHDPPDDPYHLTEAGNGEFFAREYHDSVKRDHQRRVWFVFGPHHWHRDHDGELARRALAAVRLRQRAAVVRGRVPRAQAAAHIASWVEQNIAPDERQALHEVAEAELLGLHEGNFARYQITPGEFAAWREIWGTRGAAP